MGYNLSSTLSYYNPDQVTREAVVISYASYFYIKERFSHKLVLR